jgi:NET1-associated nuclear protein 1 (U3 small nucleolar RNA-associated protein 17)
MGGTVQVFSMSTHRPIRFFQTSDSAHVTGLRLSPSVPEHIYVLTSSGHLIQWDWESDNNIATLFNFQGVTTFEVLTVHLQEKERTAVFSLRKTKNGRRTISVSLLGASSHDQENEVILFKSTKAINRFRVVRQGQCLVASSSQDLIVGIPKDKGSKSLATEYTWREVSLPFQITSLDVRETPVSDSIADRIASSAIHTSVDIALGESNGSILVYRDIINALHRNDHVTPGEEKGLPLFEQLHWHREAVRSICWSRDGM